MRKASELVQIAKDDPRYLTTILNLCHVCIELRIEQVFTRDEFSSVVEHIKASLGGLAFLRTHLRNQGAIAHTDDERSRYFAKPARAHWNMLIAELKDKGL